MFLFRKKRYKKWKYTDVIIKIQDIVHNQVPEFRKRMHVNGNEKYVCIRDMENICIYIKENQFEEFEKLDFIYDKKNELINVSNILKLKIISDRYPQVANHTSPPSVSIRECVLCSYNGINIYVSRAIILKLEDELFEDLINLQVMKEKYNFLNYKEDL